MASSEFARKQLEKHGWKTGSGLGKTEHGMCDPIKVTLKMDKAGMGHDSGKEFTDHWWLRAFNDAAKKTGTKKQETVESPQEKQKSQMSERKRKFYAGFVKSSTLQDGVEQEEDPVSEEEEDDAPLENLPTLDDLHKLCGGANGSRAAAAGIKMSGKLARVAEQDRMFEEKQKLKESKQMKIDEELTGQTSPSNLQEDGSHKDRKKKKKRKQKDAEAKSSSEMNSSVNECLGVTDVCEATEKKKKKSRKLVDEVDVDNIDESSDCVEQKKKKKKKRDKNDKNSEESCNDTKKKAKELQEEEEVNAHSVPSESNESSMKKKRKHKSNSEENLAIEIQDDDEIKSKKKKKRKRKDSDEDLLMEDHQVEDESKSKKKIKKSNKKL